MSVAALLQNRAPEVAPRRAVLVSTPGPVTDELLRLGVAEHRVEAPGSADVPTFIYVPRPARPPDTAPDLVHARAVFAAWRDAGVRHAIVLSSTAAYGSTPHHAGLVCEDRTAPPQNQPIARAWLELEAAAADAFTGATLTVLRAAPTLAPGGPDFFSRLFDGSAAATLAGHDPTLQFLSVRDLVAAIRCALERDRPGIFNIAPAAPIPLAAALQVAGCRRVPLPWVLHLAARWLLARRASLGSPEQLQFLRYHLTASPEKSARELGFVARETSADAVASTRAGTATRLRSASDRQFDPFGLDRSYIERCRRGFLGFLHRRYWRVETRGLEHIPSRGPGVLVGMHRGFMPFDGVMTLLSVVEGTSRVPRFLIHPGVGLRFPFLFNLMSKLGGVIACRENAERVLESGELLGVYPEGIRGAFTMYRRAHRVGPSWRNDCVAFALRHRAPLLPFVTIGSAEIFPILGRIDWAWWKKYTEWPFIPITPTFPLLPVPLPTKWHTVFLEPLDVSSEHGPEAADDPAVVKAIGMVLKARMETAVTELVSRRPSVFYGSLREGGTS